MAHVEDGIDQEDVNMYEHMFGIDWVGSKREGKFFSDMSFSYLSWRSIDALVKGDSQTHEFDENTKKEITFSILPGGMNFLTKLHSKPEVINDILAVSFEEKEHQDDDPKIKYSFPYLRDMFGFCPIRICLEEQEWMTINFLLKNFIGQPVDHHARLVSQLIP